MLFAINFSPETTSSGECLTPLQLKNGKRWYRLFVFFSDMLGKINPTDMNVDSEKAKKSKFLN